MSLHGRPFLRRGPSGPLAASAAREIVQIGYDQSDDNMLVPPSAAAFFPRTSDGAPLKVVLTDVTPGNVLEVDWRLNLEAAIDVAYPANFNFQAIAVVTFDGSAPAIPSATTFYISNSWGTSRFENTIDEKEDIGDRQSISSLALITIPVGATIATVELLYMSEEGAVLVGAAEAADFDNDGIGSLLKVWELAPELVSQHGPGNLVVVT